ncbi:MAG: hypothetical protein H7255_17670 [Ramlibacter sp.]|nr:hypothetical protein [Ramlibacter sp.]
MAIINGSNGNDPLLGSSLADTINGFAGIDTIFGGAGNDVINGGDDADYLGGDAGDDTIDGGAGYDTAYYDVAPSAVNVNLTANSATGGDGTDTLLNIEGVVGSLFNDTITGNADDNDIVGDTGNDLLAGLFGSDYLIGGEGADTLLGGDGIDYLFGGAGNDNIDGGAGVDVAIFDKAASGYTITQQGNNVIVTSVADGSDTLSGIEHLTFTDVFFATLAQGTGLLAAKAVGTVFGAGALSDVALVGQYMALIEGGLTMEETIAVAIASDRFATAAGSHSNSDFVNYVYHNVAGVLPDAPTHASLTQLLDSGVFTQAKLGEMATAYFTPAGFILAVTPQTLSIIAGTEGADSSLAGTVAADFLFGRGGNDVFFSGPGSDVINGGAGIDRSVYANAKSTYAVTLSDLGISVKDNASADKDVLESVERLTFSDTSVAYDISGNAGTAAKVVAVMFGAATLHDKAVVGQYLAMLDSGMSYEAVCGAAASSALFAAQAGGHSSAQFVDHVFFNLAGIHPGAQDLQTYVNLLDTQGYTQGLLGMLAADTIYNLAHVNLTGLAQTGLEYTVA